MERYPVGPDELDTGRRAAVATAGAKRVSNRVMIPENDAR
jgi:hypothetical protein